MALLSWLVLSCLARDCSAQLQAGDVAVVAYNTDSPDAFAWVALRDLPSNTVIHFTNSSVSNGWFRWGDHLGRVVSPGPLTWTSTNRVPAGTVVTWVSGTQKCWSVGLLSGGALTLSADGDQIIAYTGSITSNAAGTAPWIGDCSQATCLFALNFANPGWDNTAGGGPSTSFIPPGVSLAAGTAVHVNGQDNGYYAGPVTGVVARVRSALAAAGSWITSDLYLETNAWPVAFTILGRQGTVIRVW